MVAHPQSEIRNSQLAAPALAVRALTKTYPAPGGAPGLTVLRSVSFEVAVGESIAIVGPSGSGKTTLLGLCAGLDRATSGSVALGGVVLDDLDEDARARVRNERTGFVFQNFQLIPTLTARENVLVPAELRPAPAGRSRRDVLREHEKLAADLLASVGLGDRLDHYPVQLSGGEQQRVALARAFVLRPPIVLADEPTGNLDTANGAHILELLLNLNKTEGTTLVLVTHDPVLATYADRVITLRDGLIVSDTLNPNSATL